MLEQDQGNSNVLKGIRCPKCGSEEPFTIESTTFFTVFDSGTDDFEDVQWDQDSSIRCVQCGHGGTVDAFTVAARQRIKIGQAAEIEIRRDDVEGKILIDEHGNLTAWVWRRCHD